MLGRCRPTSVLSAVFSVFCTQGEGYQARLFQCEFTKDLVLDGTDVEHHTDGRLHQVGHTERRFTGYMLVCNDPGPDYNYFVFVRYSAVMGLHKLSCQYLGALRHFLLSQSHCSPCNKY